MNIDPVESSTQRGPPAMLSLPNENQPLDGPALSARVATDSQLHICRDCGVSLRR
jgi:hypothetical protein